MGLVDEAPGTDWSNKRSGGSGDKEEEASLFKRSSCNGDECFGSGDVRIDELELCWLVGESVAW